MAGISITSLGRGQCCMLCCNQLYSTGFNIYSARTYHGEKSFYAKLLELTNYTASMPQLVSDSLCSVCATMVSQVDQLEYQLSHVISQIRALFHKMVQSQTEVASRQGRAPHAPQGLPGGAARASSAEAVHTSSTYLPEVKTEPRTDHPAQAASFFAKKPPKENGTPSSTATRRPSWTPGLPAPPGEPQAAPQPAGAAPSASQTDDGIFNIGAFLQTDLREPAVSSASAAAAAAAASVAAAAAAAASAADFTVKFVRAVDADDAYRFQCVLCNKLGDCEEAIRRHVRADHPGADRISFPSAAPAGKRGRPAGGAAAKAPASKVPRSITASSPAMAQKIAERAYVCAGCDKAFGCEAFLTRHVTSQHCGRMYSCQYCGKEFSRSDKKVRHERSHTGERPFSCSFCGKAFSRRDKCTYHEKSHTRHRPFECQRCGEVMFSAGAYATHRQSCSDEVQGTGSLWQSQARQADLPPPEAGDA